jgi:hypothetical protein
VKIRSQWRLGRWGSSTAACGGNNGARELAAGGGEGGQRRAAEQSTSAAPEEEEKGDFPRDLFVKLKKHRGSMVNLTFPNDTEI